MINKDIKLGQYLDKDNLYLKFWKKYENLNSLPNYLGEVITYDFKEFTKKAYSESDNFAEDLVLSLLSGNVIILKNAFDESFLINLKRKLSHIFLNGQSSFHKIIENCPNFYRNITNDLSKKYAFHQVKQTHYFFPWNDDFHNLYFETYKRWQVLKYISGFKKNAWEKNTPKDGIVDRIQLVRYPPNHGELELHQDPYLYQKFFISVYMSKKGKDYINGGMYFVDKNNKKIEFEDLVDIGDLAFGFGTIYHGVDITNVSMEEFDKISSGRWFMGLYSTVSDYIEKRHTGNPAR